MKIGVVITYSAGREENVERVLTSLSEMNRHPEVVVLVVDGEAEWPQNDNLQPYPVIVHDRQKYQPGIGMEQPRNYGARLIYDIEPSFTDVWFLDSDILVVPEALDAYHQAARQAGPGAVLVGPYDWMPAGVQVPMRELFNDPRWEMFNERGPGPFIADLGVALGNFGGNLVWPLEEFIHVGGFHPMLHHGRCEDGELGLRAASMRIPMALVSAARGFHMAHPINAEEMVRRNARDVPLLNAWHPWVSQKGIIMTDQDGARFEFRCSCGQQVNTLAMWQHFADHPADSPPPNLILPEGL